MPPLAEATTLPAIGDTPERVLRVAELNRAVRSMLEGSWSAVWVEGELSDVTRAVSGHLYFTLNDEAEPAQLRGVMFRGDARRLRFELANGLRVRLRGTLSLYEARGNFQLLARFGMLAGEGDAALRFERLRQQLAQEGLLDPARKRALPRVPRSVGVVTSRSGAALHDIIQVASGRCPVRLVIADCRVQGEGAPASIVTALNAIQQVADLDVVVLARGGGAAEDLWAFNDERVVRAVAACRVPTVSGVGHEIDVTLVDLVADLRAATPSNAAELVVPERQALLGELGSRKQRLQHAIMARLSNARLQLQRLAMRQQDPRRRLWSTRQRLDALSVDLIEQLRRHLQQQRSRWRALETRLLYHDARSRLSRHRAALQSLEQRLHHAWPLVVGDQRRCLAALDGRLRRAVQPVVTARRLAWAEQASRLDALSPLKVLGRGYAIALQQRSGKALLRSTDAEVGDRLQLRLATGTLLARVEAKDSP